MQHTKLAAALFAALSANALANVKTPPAAEYTLDEIIVTATRIATPVRSVLADVTVLTAEQIAQSGSTSLAELMATVPGVEVTVNGGLGGNQNVRVRGSSANHFLVLIDGQRVSSATTGATALEHLPLHAIERVELVRAPASNLYGMDAVGGVMQVFTKQSAGRMTVEAGLGAYGFRQASADLSSRFGAWQAALSAGHAENNGFSSASPKALYGAYDADRDAYRNDSLKASLGYDWNDGGVSLGILNVDTLTEFDDANAGADYSNQTLSSQTLRLRQTWGDGIKSSLHVGSSKDDLVTVSGNPSRFQTEQRQLTLENSLRLGRGDLLVGAEYLRQEVTATSNFTQRAREVKSLFAGYGLRTGRHSAQLNARQDDNSQFGAKTTGGLSYGYELQPGLRVHATAATAFKAPTFNDLYFPFTDYGGGWTYTGNPNLKPERARNLEVGVSQSRSSYSLSATLYRQRVADLILASSGAAADAPVNVGSAEIDGLELAGRQRLGAYTLETGLTWQSAVNSETHKELTYRANQFGFFRLGHQAGKTTWAAEIRFEGERFDDTSNTRKVAGYELFNVSMTHQLAKDWQLRMRLDNAFDRKYEQVYGFNTPGRSLFAFLRYTPK